MKKLRIFLLFASVSYAADPRQNIVIANAGSTGTTISKLAKLTGAPSTAVISGTSDTGGAIGIVIAGAGTTGSATIQVSGRASCVFDGATTAGHYVQLSSSTAGDCHDAGSTYPTSGQVIARVLSTNGSGGTYQVDLFPAEIVASSGTTSDVTSSAHGLAPISPADATKFLNGAATPAYAQVKDSDLSVSNVTTNNVTSSQHGFQPTLSGNASDCLHGDGTYSGCSGGGGSGTSPFYFGPALTALDSVSNWSSVNLSCTGCGSTRINTNTAEQIVFRDSGSLNWRLRVENVPATPYTITGTLTCSLYTEGNSVVCGIYLYDGTKLEGIELLSQGGVMLFRVEQMNSVTSDHATLCNSQYTGNIIGRTLNFRIKDDGTTRTFYYSEDDGNTFSSSWSTWGTPATCQETDASGWLTVTKIGYGGLSAIGGSSAVAEIVRLVSWKITSP